MHKSRIRVGGWFSTGPFGIREVMYGSAVRQATHAHEFMSVTLVLSGAIRENAGGAEEIGSPLSVVVKPVGVEHRNEVGPRGARTIQIAFDPGDLAPLIDRDPVLQNYGWHLGGMAAAGMLVLVRLMQRAGPADPAEVESRIVDALGALTREPRARGTPPRWILRVRERLDDEIGVSVRELAAGAGVHAVSVSRAFRRHFGRSICEYRSQERLRRAAVELDGEPGHLSRAAHVAGYADHSHLCREFRRATGCSPSQFRELARRQSERGLSPFKRMSPPAVSWTGGHGRVGQTGRPV